MATQFLNEVGVEIESLAPGGDAVGRQLGGQGARAADDGRVTFVPLAAPGERVRARIEREKGKPPGPSWSRSSARARTVCRRRARCSESAGVASGSR